MFQSIISVIKYFAFFDYAPSFEEIYRFLPEKTTKKELKQELRYLVRKKLIKNLKLKIENFDRYTLGEYSIKSQKSPTDSDGKIQNSKSLNQKLRLQMSYKKLKNLRFQLYIKLLSLFPQIKLVGLSGSVAMMSAKEEDDIDLFIITAKNRLFTGRLIALFLAETLGIRRKFTDKSSKSHVSRFNNKVCLNLFFDERDLAVPHFKRNLYVAHEVLQMKPIVNKDYTYKKFLEANQWVNDFFPNALLSNSKFKIQNLKVKLKGQKFIFFDKFFNFIEYFLKKIQLFFINRHRTTEIINATQLWFHPNDFEKKLEIKSSKSSFRV